MRLKLIIIWLLFFPSCPKKEFKNTEIVHAPSQTDIINTDSIVNAPPGVVPVLAPKGSQYINTASTSPEELLNYAKTLIGTPYKYASTDPLIGFDCSGFITYVFNHFHIAVPRSSIDFTNVEKAIPLADAKPGDIVLFTGTDSTTREVGHMGIITSKENDEYFFIHSSSGKAKGVTISLLNKYYSFRFVKTIRVFSQNGPLL